MQIHADPAAVESHPFNFQSQTLFSTFFSRKGDSATGAHHAMPWQSICPLECPYGLTRRTRESGSLSHLAVRDHRSPRHPGYHRSKQCKRGHRSGLVEGETGEVL